MRWVDYIEDAHGAKQDTEKFFNVSLGSLFVGLVVVVLLRLFTGVSMLELMGIEISLTWAQDLLLPAILWGIVVAIVFSLNYGKRIGRRQALRELHQSAPPTVSGLPPHHAAGTSIDKSDFGKELDKII